MVAPGLRQAVTSGGAAGEGASRSLVVLQRCWAKEPLALAQWRASPYV